MTLPASGAISLGDVNTELGFSATAQIGMNDAAVRELFGIAAGAIDLNTGHGRTRQVMVAGIYTGTIQGLEYIGYASGGIPFGSLTPTSVGAYTVINMFRRKSTVTQEFQLFELLLAGTNVPQNTFSTITINGQTYSSASATYDGNYGAANTRWTWTTPDPALVNGNTYNTIFAP